MVAWTASGCRPAHRESAARLILATSEHVAKVWPAGSEKCLDLLAQGEKGCQALVEAHRALGHRQVTAG
jgi:hypothetical protein